MKKRIFYILSLLLYIACFSNTYAQESKFVSNNFIIPDTLETEKFRMRMLSVDDAEKRL